MFEAAAVDRRIRRNDHLIRHARGGNRLRKAAVGRTFGRRAGTFQVDRHIAVLDGDGQVDEDRLHHGAVIIEIAGSMVNAVGKFRNHFFFHDLGLQEDIMHAVAHRIIAKALDDLGKAFFPGLAGGDLRIEVAARRTVKTGIAADHIRQAFIEHAAVHNLHRRNADALLKDLRGIQRIARVFRTDIQPVGAVGGKAAEPALVKDGRKQRHIVQMRACHIGIVDDIHVAFIVVFNAADAFCRRLDRHFQIAQEHGHADRKAQRVGIFIKQAGRAILRFIDDRRIGAAVEAFVHLFCRGDECIAHDLGCNRVAPELHLIRSHILSSFPG